MNANNSLKLAFLYELYKRAGGDFEAQISMYEIGADLGLEKENVDMLAQDLFIENLAEMKTLSGGMGITQKGFETLDIEMPESSDAMSFKLGNDPVLNDKDKEAVHKLIDKIRKNFGSNGFPHDYTEEIVIDIKTIEVQMLSLNPKTHIIKAVFKSISNSFNNSDIKELKNDLLSIIS